MLKACTKCKRLVEKKQCDACGSKELAKKWAGLVVIFNLENSEIAEKIKATKPGKYALRVKE